MPSPGHEFQFLSSWVNFLLVTLFLPDSVVKLVP